MLPKIKPRTGGNEARILTAVGAPTGAAVPVRLYQAAEKHVPLRRTGRKVVAVFPHGGNLEPVTDFRARDVGHTFTGNPTSRSRMPKPLTSAPPGTPRYAGYADQESAVTDAVGFAPSLLPRPGAVAITVTTTSALDRVSGVVCGDACVPGFLTGFGCGLARESVGGVGLEVGL